VTTEPPPLPERNSMPRTEDSLIEELEKRNADLERQLDMKKQRKEERKINKIIAEIQQKETQLDLPTGNIIWLLLWSHKKKI